MKTRLFVLCVLVTVASSAFAETYQAPIKRPKQQPEKKAPALTTRDVGGVIPRGIRGGNFLQMFNPKAPAKYGTSIEAISYDPSEMNRDPRHNEAGKWRGIKLFAFQF